MKSVSPAANVQEPSPDRDAPLHQFRKNSIEVVRASLSTFHGHELADLRVYFQADDGTLRPTKKGLSIGVDLLPELRAAVAALEAEAQARGIGG